MWIPNPKVARSSRAGVILLTPPGRAGYHSGRRAFFICEIPGGTVSGTDWIHCFTGRAPGLPPQAFEPWRDNRALFSEGNVETQPPLLSRSLAFVF